MRIKRLKYLLLTIVCIFSFHTAHADDRNLLPKYGNLPKEQWQKDADEKFIEGMKEQYHGDLIKASSDTAMRGWQYLYQGDSDTAMRRFNQAWLLNPKNGTALWGMAAIVADAGKLDEALQLFSEADQYVGEEINFKVDYARAVATASTKRNDEKLRKDAFDRFQSIYQAAPQNARNLQNWAILLFSLGRYKEAQEKINLAQATPDNKVLDPRFLADLKLHLNQSQK